MGEPSGYIIAFCIGAVAGCAYWWILRRIAERPRSANGDSILSPSDLHRLILDRTGISAGSDGRKHTVADLWEKTHDLRNRVQTLEIHHEGQDLNNRVRKLEFRQDVHQLAGEVRELRTLLEHARSEQAATAAQVTRLNAALREAWLQLARLDRTQHTTARPRRQRRWWHRHPHTPGPVDVAAPEGLTCSGAD